MISSIRRTITANRGPPPMETTLANLLFILILVVLFAIAAQFGVDSRDGFGDDHLREPFR
jgi:hypothetical protein